MEKVGILYICTGEYKIFWPEFYNSVNSFFLNDMKKFFFVWTDAQEIFEQAEREDNIQCIYQKTEQWPYPTLKRFEYFLKAEDSLKQMDYLVFMNGNLRVNETIVSKDIFPNEAEDLFVTLHPGFYSSSPEEFTYDNNPKCLAYIKKGEGEHYFAGGFNGGKTEAYLKMAKCLRDRINKDLDNGVIAIWHDESHLNRYIYDYDDTKYRILSPEYLYPEGWNIPFQEKITVLDKNKKGGHGYLRNEKKRFCIKSLLRIKRNN